MAVLVRIVSAFDDRGVKAAQRSIALVGAKAKALKGIESPLARWGADMVRVGRVLDERGRQLQQFGQTMTTRVTLPLAAAGAASVKLAADFNSSMSKIGSLVGMSQRQVESYKASVLEMAKGLPQAPKELADALFFITSAGVKGKTALEVLEASAKAAVAGLGDAQTVADAATSALNAYGAANLSAQQATDVLVATVREGKMEPAELAGSLGKVIPVASAMGVEFHEVGAAVAAMSRTGMNAAEATTALRAMLSQLMKPSKQTADGLKAVGLTVKEVQASIRDKGLFPTLQMLMDRFDGNATAAARVFGNVRGLTGVLSIAGKNAGSNARIFDKLAHSAGDTARAFERAKETDPSIRFKQAMSSLQVAAIKLGNALLPTVTQLVDRLGKLADAFAGLSDGQRRAIIYAAGVAAAIGPVSSVVGTAMRAVGAFSRAIGGLGMALGGVKKGVPLYARAIAGVVKGTGKAAGAIASLARTAASSLGSALATSAKAVGALGRTVATGLVSAVSAAGRAMAALWATLLANPIVLVIAGAVALGVALVALYKRSETFRRIVNTAFAAVRKVGLAVFHALKAAVQWYVDGLRRNIATARAVLNGLVSAFRAMAGAVSGAISRVVSFVAGLRARIVGALEDAGRWLIDIGRRLIEGLVTGIKDRVKRVLDTVRGLGDKVKGALKSALGISSPSKVFRAYGRALMEGLALGIGDAARLPQLALAGAAAGLAVPATAAVPAAQARGSTVVVGRGAVTVHVTVTGGGDREAVRRAVTRGVEDGWERLARELRAVKR
jgi:TP901 family phage tail tape measure protein